MAAGLGAEDAGANLQIGCRVDAHLDGGIGDMQGVGRRARQHIDLHILEHLDLTLGVARGNGNDRAAGRLAASMGAQAAGEQAVAVGDLHGGVFVAIADGKAARKALAPMLQIVFRAPDDRGLTGGAGRRMQAHDLRSRHGEQAVRIVVAHVLLKDERELRDVFERFQIARFDAGVLEALLIERDVVIRVLHAPLHALELQIAQLLT